jgi:hypothetical protein
MLGGMEEDPEVGDPPLAKLVGLHFGFPSNEDTISYKLHQLLLLAFFFLVLITWYLFHASVLYFAPLVTVREGAECVCSRKFGHLLCCGLCFLFFSVCFFASFVDVFVGVVKMYAVRGCDRDGE